MYIHKFVLQRLTGSAHNYGMIEFAMTVEIKIDLLVCRLYNFCKSEIQIIEEKS